MTTHHRTLCQARLNPKDSQSPTIVYPISLTFDRYKVRVFKNYGGIIAFVASDVTKVLKLPKPHRPRQLGDHITEQGEPISYYYLWDIVNMCHNPLNRVRHDFLWSVCYEFMHVLMVHTPNTLNQDAIQKRMNTIWQL